MGDPVELSAFTQWCLPTGLQKTLEKNQSLFVLFGQAVI